MKIKIIITIIHQFIKEYAIGIGEKVPQTMLNIHQEVQGSATIGNKKKKDKNATTDIKTTAADTKNTPNTFMTLLPMIINDIPNQKP